MSEDRVLAALRARRLHWVEIEPGRRVQFARPPETEMHRLVDGIFVEQVIEYVRAWDGFTEATILGAAIGSSDSVEFSRELWAEYVSDHAEEVAKVAKGIAEAVRDHLKAREATAKN